MDHWSWTAFASVRMMRTLRTQHAGNNGWWARFGCLTWMSKSIPIWWFYFEMGWKFAQRFFLKIVTRDRYSEMSLYGNPLVTLVTQKEIFSHGDQSAKYVLFWLAGCTFHARLWRGSSGDEGLGMKPNNYRIFMLLCCDSLDSRGLWTLKNHEKSSKHRRKLTVKQERENWANEILGVFFCFGSKVSQDTGVGGVRVLWPC